MNPVWYIDADFAPPLRLRIASKARRDNKVKIMAIVSRIDRRMAQLSDLDGHWNLRLRSFPNASASSPQSATGGFR